MQPASRPAPTSRGRALSLLALLGMAVIIGGLLAVNYVSHRNLELANCKRFQQNLEDRCRSLSYFFSERENDLRSLAQSTAVTAYFTNRSLGMTMTYGLRASLNNIDRLFAQRAAVSRLGAAAIYCQLYLLDGAGIPLSSWPAGTVATAQAVPEIADQQSSPVVMTSQSDGVLTFSSPVYQNERVVGYVGGRMQYATLVDYLLKDLPGSLVITDGDTPVFHSRADSLPSNELSSLLRDQPQAAEAAASPVPRADGSELLHHFAAVPGYPIRLHILEPSHASDDRRTRLVFMASLAALSLAAFGAVALTLQAGARKLVLETSLAESCKREKILAEKKEELELVLDGARLGTWSWDLIRHQEEWNERYCAMLGYAPGELRHHPDTWQELIHPDDRLHVLSSIELHLTGITPFYAAEYRMLHKSGHWVWVHDAGKIVQRDQSGRPLRAFGIHLDITERKESVRLLARAKEESDAIIRNFLDTLIVVNTSLVVVRVNQATCDLLGLKEKALIGRHVGELFHDSAARIEEVFAFYTAPARAGVEELRNVELCYRLADGGRRPMSFNISLLTNDSGVITGVAAGGKDIAHIRLALDKIARQKEYIETLFDLIPAGLLTISPEREVLQSNRAFRAILSACAGRLGLREEECAAMLTARILEAQSESDTFTLPLRHGEATAFFRCNSTMVDILEGVTSVIAIEDITSERRAEEERRLLATVIEQTGDSVVIAGTDRIVRYVNPATVRNIGYSERELVGAMLRIFTDGLMAPQELDDLSATLDAGRPWHGHSHSRRKDGEVIEEDVTISPVRDSDGELTHYVAIKRDITEMIQLQRQLMQAQKLEAIGQLAAGIAHEINTPMQYVHNNVSFFESAFNDLNSLLQAIQSHCPACHNQAIAALADTVDLDFLLEEVPTSIRETHEGIGRVVKIISAMKEFSHPGTSEKICTDLNHALDNTLIVCRNEWKYVAELKTDFAVDLPPVPCFPDQLNQAVLNLVMNAAHAIATRLQIAPEPPGRITVATRRDGDWVEMQVGDNGTGIAEPIRQRIFEPFFTTKEVGRGTGQGLAIVRDIIVKKHGGRIDFTTRAGEGTTFTLRLPIAG